jgi:hypothetical protein
MTGSNNEPNGIDEMNKPTLAAPRHDFQEKWDLTTKHEIVNNTANRIQASEVVLAALKLRRGSETAQWLNNLQNEISSNTGIQITEQNTKANLSPLDPNITSTSFNEDTLINSAINGLDKIFDQFEIYALEFNRTTQGTDLIVSCTRPIRRTNQTDGTFTDAAAKCLSYAGHLATRLWALVVRGSPSKVEVFIIPAEFLLGFSVHSIDESGYQPLLVVESTWINNQVVWHMGQTVISAEQIPALAKELFGDLIRVASGQMSESELFAHPLQSFSLGQNLAVGYQPAPTNTATPQPINNSPAMQPTNPNQNLPASLTSLESIKAADQLLAIIDRDINKLIESGKQALQSDKGQTFEQMKMLTEKLEILKKNISVCLADIHQQ